MPKKEKPKISKTVALFFILLMLGSTIGLVIEIFLKPSGKIEIPANRVLKYKLDDNQVKVLLKNYQTVIEYEYPDNCLECSTLITSLETWATSSDNQIYLQELSGSNINKLTITSLRGQKILYDPTPEEARSDICELIINRPIFCLEV
ncbi:MAG: hypothetical protein QXY45_03260 [Candidatus Aenigmatarchaeota archaeon]